MKVSGPSLSLVLESVVLRCCAAALLSFLVTSAPAKCQGEQAGNQLVIHLYVDPIYGNDGAVNSWFNPDGVAPECAGATIVGPHSVVDGSGGSLFHAPYPFKTVTAAIARINQLSPAPGIPPLPHTDPGTQKIWSYCIIHMLPGWYGRTNGQGGTGGRNESLEFRTGTHKANRLVPNGEVFPLHVPPRVSLVGTSALNTLVDLGQVGTAIEFGVFDQNGVAINGNDVLIDKITFFACGGLVDDLATRRAETNPKKCAAILVDDQVPSNPTIANCFFQKNALGVVVNAGVDPVYDPRLGPVPIAVEHHGVTIANCTFAWNIVGLWNGQLASQNGSRGVSRLNIINCIFDGSEPQGAALPCNYIAAPAINGAWPAWQYAVAGSANTGSGILSAFEGLAQEDLRILGPSGPVDTNAYEAASFAVGGIVQRNYNTGSQMPFAGIAGTIPSTSSRSGATPVVFDPDPARNIAHITGWPDQTKATNVTTERRGILYVADLVCRGSASGSFQPPGLLVSGGGFDLSMHDLRLSPFAEEAWLNPSVPGSQRPAPIPNPLVDSGISGPFPMVMENGNILYGPPGSTPASGVASQSVWPHHAWESDAEGFGNPRIHDHPSHSGMMTAGSGPIDVGADELGELVVAGYRFGTTTFLSLAGVHPDNQDDSGGPLPALVNDHVFFLGPPTSAPFALPPKQVGLPSFRAVDHFIHFIQGYDYPTTYLPYPGLAVTTGRVWSSAEFPEPSSGSPSRPAFTHRKQAIGRMQTQLGIPGSILPSGNFVTDMLAAFMQVGASYRATPADVTPVLLPDIHPWWTDLPPLVLVSLQAYAMSPSFFSWQDAVNCPSGNYFYNQVVVGGVPFGFHNPMLYQYPGAFDINPPGANSGGTLTVAVPGTGTAPYQESYSWLDLAPSPDGSMTVAVDIGSWLSTPIMISNFDSYGCGGTGLVRSLALPSTRVLDPAGTGSELSQLGFTLEWSDLSVPWILPAGVNRQANMQAFKVIVDERSN